MRPKWLTWHSRAPWRTSVLIALCALLLGCEALFIPLRDAPAETVDSGVSVPSLVRLAVGWEAGPLAEDLVTSYRAYRPGVTIQPLTMSGASALQAVTAGEMDLALVAAVDNAALEEMAPGLRYARVARDGLAVVVHQSSILNQVSIVDLQALFSGEIVDWSALGQTGGRPLLAVQTRSATTRSVFDEGVMQAVPVSTTARVFPNDEMLLAYVSSTPLAIGYVSASHFQAEAPVAILAVDLLLPTRANIEKDLYPLTHGLYVVYRAESNANADGFRAFMQSARGHAAARERHALP